MKAHPFSPRSGRRGVALVVVLSTLLLMSALLVAFMGRVSTERASQRATYSGYEAQQAAESAVNLVISQIRAATTSALDGSTGWASQPGVIRTFGTEDRVYKLYSSLQMRDTETGYNPASFQESGIDPSDPQRAVAGFVDLNQPVLIPNVDGSVEPHYPIVDPRAAKTREGSVAQPGKGKVEGFWAPQDLIHPSKSKDSNKDSVLELPMRVRWLYQLRDGTLVAPSSVSGTISRIPGATKENPPIARVAFWTDDESSKLNVNTAGENTHWDTPLASSYHESGESPTKDVTYSKGESAALAASQPTAGEYQRFPGHPATTNLSPALRWLFPKNMTKVTNAKDDMFKEAIYRLTPRYRGGQGSSMGATLANYDDVQDYRIPKRDRLFASLDEFWFRPDRSPISKKGYFGVFRSTSTNLEKDQTIVDPDVPNRDQALEQLRFFLTATSRAPELTLFGTPRVAIWPVHELDEKEPSKSKRSGYDDLIAFCSTVGGKPYYFTRARPWSTYYDYNESGPKPTDGLMDPYPGRNKQLVLGNNGDGYLRRLGSTKIPGVTGNTTFADKYSNLWNDVAISNDAAQIVVDIEEAAKTYTEWDRILLSIFDYVRTTNLVDTGRKDDSTSGYKLAYTPGYSPYDPPRYGRDDKSIVGSAQVVPTVLYADQARTRPILKGFGRIPTLSEVGLLFYRDTTTLPLDDTIVTPGPTDPDEILSFRCVILPEMQHLSSYYPGSSEGYAYTVREPVPFRVTGLRFYGGQTVTEEPLKIADGSYNFVDTNPWRIEYGRFWMPTRGYNNHFWVEGGGSIKAKLFAKPNPNNAASYPRFPFYSKRINVLKAKGTADPTEFTLERGVLEFTFHTLNVPENQTQTPPPTPTAGEALQKIYVEFPRVTLPMPRPGQPAFNTRINTRYNENSATAHYPKVEDTLRTVEPNGSARGDYRIIAGHPKAVPGHFNTSGSDAADYTNKAIRLLHNFRNGWGRPMEGAETAMIQTGGSVRTDKRAKVPARNGTAVSVDGTAVGDFDRGISKHIDGAFINHPDEGNTRFAPGDDMAGGGYLPYFRGGGGYEEVGATFFSPNRLVPSAVMFGSLPTGIFANRPWETLLFAPPTSAGHKGAVSPADHYMLDWFHMPVVEPYAISEPLSTAGKVNLNSRLAPFGYVKVDGRSYIQRHTGLWGVFKGMRQFALENSVPNGGHEESPLSKNFKSRWEIDPQSMTEKIIDPALDARKYFKSATEICELDLPLKSTFAEEPGKAIKWNPTYNNLSARRTFWNSHAMTGDNSRERPYAHIYPRITTKSNVFTVHVWAQALAKNPSGEEGLFDEATDRILGEYRGSTTVERYIDVNEDAIKNEYDAAASTSIKSLDPYYRFRVVNQKRFNPR